MKLIKAFLLSAVALLLPLSSVFAQIYDCTTIAGTAGQPGSTDGMGSLALFNWPMGPGVDTNGSVYVADYGNDTIRQIIPVSGTWVVTTIAGTPGTPGSADGFGSAASFNNPSSVALDSTGTVYVADYGNSTIRQITPVASTWLVTTLAGTAGTTGSTDGVGAGALFNNPAGVAVDSARNLYVADRGNHTIRQIALIGNTRVVTTIAGKAGQSGSADGAGSHARFNHPQAVAVDAAGRVYVADSGNNTIRQLTLSGTNWLVSTIAGKAGKSGKTDGVGSAALFSEPSGLAVLTNGSVLIADANNDAIRKLTPLGTNWTSSTIAGTAGKSGSADGTGSAARFDRPLGVTADSYGTMYVADTYNQTVRRGLPIPDTFVAFQGTYNGLALQTNAPALAASGSLKLVLTETGAFTVNLTMGTTKLSFDGQFDQTGNATNFVTSSKSGSWQVALHLDLVTGSEQVSGTVSNSQVQTEVLADRAIFTKTNPCPLEGAYTFVMMPPTGPDADLPQGWGAGTLKISTTGSGKLSGALGDGTKLTATVPISKYGTAPLYALLYSSKGACAGWLGFTGEVFDSTVEWFKPASAGSQYYAGGFTASTALLGSSYVAPAAGHYLIELSNTVGNALLALGGGNLSGVLSNAVTITSNNTVVVLAGDVTNLKLKLAAQSGTFSGQFTHPLTQKTVKFQGVMLQAQDFGAGWFTGTNETGWVTITPREQ